MRNVLTPLPPSRHVCTSGVALLLQQTFISSISSPLSIHRLTPCVYSLPARPPILAFALQLLSDSCQCSDWGPCMPCAASSQTLPIISLVTGPPAPCCVHDQCSKPCQPNIRQRFSSSKSILCTNSSLLASALSLLPPTMHCSGNTAVASIFHSCR